MSDSPLIPSAQLDALNRAIAVRVRQAGQAAARQATQRALTRDGAVKLDSGDATSGTLPAGSGGTGHDRGAEPPLGNPDADGKVLSSTTAGARSWIANGLSAEAIQDMLATFLRVGPGLTLTYDDPGTTLTISLGAPVVYLTDSSGEYLVDADGAYLVEYE